MTSLSPTLDSAVGPNESERLVTKKKVHAQLSVCVGCCCGRVDKGNPEVPVGRLKTAWKENKLLRYVQLTISGCLGPCDLKNVIKLSSARGQEWIGNITDPAEFDLLIGWAMRVKAEDRLLDLPLEFDDRRFDPYR
jgi:hypothetical protein